jgi:hypothetical protein
LIVVEVQTAPELISRVRPIQDALATSLRRKHQENGGFRPAIRIASRAFLVAAFGDFLDDLAVEGQDVIALREVPRPWCTTSSRALRGGGFRLRRRLAYSRRRLSGPESFHSIVSTHDNRLILKRNLFSFNTDTVEYTVKNLGF